MHAQRCCSAKTMPSADRLILKGLCHRVEQHDVGCAREVDARTIDTRVQQENGYATFAVVSQRADSGGTVSRDRSICALHTLQHRPDVVETRIIFRKDQDPVVGRSATLDDPE